MHTRRRFGTTALGVAALALLLAGTGRVSAAMITFNFQFDDQGLSSGEPDGTVTPPFAGTGTFTIATDPGNGTFTLASLGPFTMNYTFDDGAVFTQANITSNPALTEVVIGPFMGERRAYFTDAGSGAGGPFGGSLDLTSGTNGLTFEPSFSGGHDLYQEGSIPNGLANEGNYLGETAPAAAGAPEPASLTLLGLGALGLLGYGWRRRKPAA